MFLVAIWSMFSSHIPSHPRPIGRHRHGTSSMLCLSNSSASLPALMWRFLTVRPGHQATRPPGTRPCHLNILKCISWNILKYFDKRKEGYGRYGQNMENYEKILEGYFSSHWTKRNCLQWQVPKCSGWKLNGEMGKGGPCVALQSDVWDEVLLIRHCVLSEIVSSHARKQETKLGPFLSSSFFLFRPPEKSWRFEL